MAGEALPWVPEQLKRRALVTLTEVNHGAIHTVPETMVTNGDGLAYKSQDKEEEEEGFVSIGHYKRLQDDIALVAHLKACAMRKDLHEGSRLHAGIIDSGLLNTNNFVGNSLISMYAKCGALAMAQQVFDELADRNVISWNALVAGYVQHGDCEKAFNCFKQMQGEGLFRDAVTFACIMKACGNIGALKKGKQIHVEIVATGLLAHSTMLGNSLVDMYAKCGALAKAQQVFEEIPARDVVSWNALIAGYCQHNHGEEALSCFAQMKHEGFSPDAVTFSCIIKACGSLGAAEKGKDVHAEIVTKGLLGNNIMLGSALVDMYAKCGALAKAQLLFDELAVRDVVAWTALIVGYCQHKHAEEALNCFEQMKHEGLSPDSITFACILKACGSIQAVDKGKKIHAEIIRKGYVGNGIVLGNALVDMYAKCGALAKAQQLFKELWIRDVVSWSVLISEYCQYGHGKEALNCFEQMKSEGLSPDAVTLASILKACGSIGATEIGNEIHAEIVRKGLLRNDPVLGSALMDMYAKCGVLGKAQRVFDELSVRNVVSWNTLITGYCQDGRAEEALDCFEQMKHEGLSPDAVTYACILKACGSVGAAEKGKDLHAEVVTKGLLENNTVLGSALVDMYAKCGALEKAQEVFNELLFRDAVSWTGLITGYCQHGLGEEAVNCYGQMVREGLSPDAVTFACVLKACGSIGAAVKGLEVHSEIARMGLVEVNNVLGSALVDMYAKCGALGKAQQVFDELPSRDVVSWSALITGYSEHGHGLEALNCFERMIQEGLSPDAVIFACVLKACGSIGAPEEGQMCFDSMSSTYGIMPTLEHHTCMVDLFARAGNFDKAVAVIKEMPSFDHLPAWFALLGACQKWGNKKLGKFAFKNAVRLDERSAVGYALMSGSCDYGGMQEDVVEI